MHCTAQIGGSARGWALQVQVLAKQSLPFFSLKNRFLTIVARSYIFFADVVHPVVVERIVAVEHIELKQCKVGIAKI